MKVEIKKCAAALSIALLSALTLAGLSSCKGKAKQSSETATVVQGTEAAIEEDFTDFTEQEYVEPTISADIPGVMIAGWYYDKSEDKDGNVVMSYNFEAVVGTKVQVFGSYDPSAEFEGADFVKNAIVDGNKRDFIHILYDGEEYWVRDYSIAVNAFPGVTSEDNLYLYTKPDLSLLGKRSVPVGTILAVFNDQPSQDEDPTGMFAKIRYYVPENKVYTVEGYLLTNVIDPKASSVAVRMCENKIATLKAAGGVDSSVIEELTENIRALRNADDER